MPPRVSLTHWGQICVNNCICFFLQRNITYISFRPQKSGICLWQEDVSVTGKKKDIIFSNMIWKDTCISMFIAVLFAIPKMWKQPKCPSTEEWIKKVRYIYTREYYSAIKRNKITPLVATWMNLEILILSEICQRQISYDITHTWN